MDQKKFAVINQPALWRQAEGMMGLDSLPTDEMNVRAYAGGTKYVKGNVIVYATATEPIFRYVKNYRKHKLNFSIFMYSDDPDRSKVEKYFDSLVNKTIKKTNIAEAIATATMSDFVYLSDSYK